MEQTRIIYETLIGKRCSDTHWSKTKKLMVACELPQDKDGFNVLINLRKVSPRYFTKYVEIKDELTQLGKQLLPAIGLGITGEQFINLIQNLEIHPNQQYQGGLNQSVVSNLKGFIQSKPSYQLSLQP